jgi:hypothetical protein
VQRKSGKTARPQSGDFAFRVKVCAMGNLRDSWQATGRYGLALLAIALIPAFSDAAWLGYKNNTGGIVVIQAADLVVVNGQVKTGRPGKAHTLYPGELAWDPIAAPGSRMITVYDPKQNNRVIYQERVDCNKNDIFLSLQMVQPPTVRGQPPPPPALKLLPTVLPSQAPGILPPGSMPSNLTSGPSTPPGPSTRPSTPSPTSRPPTQ